MATKPISKFTVQESNNIQVYENYSFETLNTVQNDSGAWNAAANITGSNPAKEIVLIDVGSTAYEATDILYVILNDSIDANASTTVDGSDSKVIIIPQPMLPFTISNLLVTKFEVSCNDDNTNERLGVLALH